VCDIKIMESVKYLGEKNAQSSDVPIFHVTDASLEEVKAYCKLTQLMATGGARPP
jgi:hypothetical protein